MISLKKKTAKKYSLKELSFIVFLLFLSGLSSPLKADIYYWTDEKGVRHFTNTDVSKDSDFMKKPEYIKSPEKIKQEEKDSENDEAPQKIPKIFREQSDFKEKKKKRETHLREYLCIESKDYLEEWKSYNWKKARNEEYRRALKKIAKKKRKRLKISIFKTARKEYNNRLNYLSEQVQCNCHDNCAKFKAMQIEKRINIF